MLTPHTINDLYATLNLPTDQDIHFTIQRVPDIHPHLPFVSPVMRADYFSFILTVRGRGIYKLDDHAFPFGDHSFYFTNPGHVKAYELHEAEEALIIMTTERFLSRHVADRLYEEFPFLLAEIVPPHLPAEADFADYRQLFRQIEEEARRPSVYRNKILGNLLLVLLLKIKENFWADYNPLRDGDQDSVIVANFKKALEEEFAGILGGHDRRATLRAQYFAERLNLQSVRTLAPAKGTLRKLTVYTPVESTDAVAAALFAAGAGQIGDYDQASFRTAGTGTFRPLEGAQPAIGSVGAQESVREHRLEVVVPQVLAKAALAAAKRAHPYEEVAYDLVALENDHPDFGMGAVGDLPDAMDHREWLEYLCDCMELDALKCTADTAKPIERVAVCGGVGSFLLGAAKGARADVFVTADYKYHEFFDAEGQLLICDVGHYESERYTIDLLYELISTRFDTFAARMTARNTNPVEFYVPTGTPHKTA